MGFIALKDLIDILLVGTILYWIFRLLKRSGATQLFWGIVVIVAGWILFSNILQMELTGAIFNHIIDAGVIAIIIIFQEELRSLIYQMGSRFSISSWWKRAQAQAGGVDTSVEEILRACKNMSESKTGALIVLGGSDPLKEFTDTGEAIHATISARLIENIFFKNTPLHDGAMIISGNKIQAAACLLPVSKDPSIPQHYGLRHRAALGLTEKTTATAIVVSEETGHISVAVGENIREVTLEELVQETTRALRTRS